MGLRSSKHNRNSYDVAPVVSNKDFSYKKHTKPLPKVELPVAAATIAEENEELSVNNEHEATTRNEEEKTDVQDPRIPEWVNETNFKKLLLKTHPNIREIVSFKAFPAMAAGENYATLMLRIKITAKFENDTTKDFSFMLKVPHNTKEMKDMMMAMNFFITENTVYSDVLPELEEMYHKAGVEVTFGPKSHRLDLEDANIHYVLLDDLSVEGFKNANRLECLNMEHTLSVLRKMAQFHAASACRVATKGAYPAVFSPDMDNEFARAMMSQMFMAFKKPFLDNLKNYENGEKYRDVMDHFFDNLIELFVRSRKLLPGYFSVLNHGDSWSNNILFKYADNNKVVETLYVDFQNSNWGSPALDLYYFIISSVQIDIKLSQFDYFIRYYHEHLTQNLKLLQYPLEIPNLREFHMQMLDFGSMATMTSFFTLGVVLLEPTNAAKFENFLGDSEECYNFKNTMYSNKRYIKYINEILPWLHNRGFMEINLTDLDNRIAAADKLRNKTAVTTVSEQQENIEQSSNCYPEWVNESLFIDVVRADCENYQKILKFAVSPATIAGDNYSSIMLKVDIVIELTDHTTRSLSYMLKIPPNGEQAKAVMSLLNTFEKEITAYREIIPQFEKIYKEQSGIDIVFAPKSFEIKQTNESDILVLENLRTKGFQNCDRLEGLDMKHTEAVLKKLAEFHAASAYIFETKGKYPEIYERSIYTEDSKEVREKMGDSFLKIYLECLKQYEGHEEYINEVETYLKDPDTHLIKASTIDWNKFNVLNHGDCWTNNIMFQHDDAGNIVNTLFVDFQLVKYGSPCYDLYYFLLSSPKLELKLQQFDYFIRYYHENLKHNLELLKYPKEIPSLKDLHMELLDNGVWALNTVMGVMSAVLLDPSDKPSLEKMISDDDAGLALKKQMFLNKRYRSHAEAIYPWLHRRGLLNFKPKLALNYIPTKQCHVPSWVNAEHFEDILKESVNNFKKIINVNAVPATKSGDNYASSLLRVKVDYETNDGSVSTVSYILKLPLQSEEESGIVSLWNFFDKEISMYSKYLKEFEDMYKEVGVEFNFRPKYYSFTKDVGKDVLLLEDLSQRGFRNGDRREGLDMEHSKCVLEKLAQFHAVSAKYVEVNGSFPQVFHKGIYTEESREVFKQMNLDFMCDYFKAYEGYEEYKDKLPNLINNFVDHGIRVSTVDPNEFNVLNHGDSWLNNIMFKHDPSGHIEETYFVDFQVCKYGSPTQDLWYFLMSSTELALKVDSFDYFIKYYHDNLLKNLQLLKYSGSVPTLPELHAALLKYGYTGFNTFFGVGAVCLLESSENANMTNFTAKTEEGEKFRKALFLNDRYKAHAAVVLPWLARRGCLD